jgi:uncharacterized integral membrane protein
VLSWLIGLPLAAVIVVFALSNRQDVAIGLWPFEQSLALPLFLVVLVPLIVGLALGLLVGSVRALRHRRAARTLAKRAERLEREVEGLKTRSAADETAPPPGGGQPPLPT